MNFRILRSKKVAAMQQKQQKSEKSQPCRFQDRLMSRNEKRAMNNLRLVGAGWPGKSCIQCLELFRRERQ
jgi:hypothetical protein